MARPVSAQELLQVQPAQRPQLALEQGQAAGLLQPEPEPAVLLLVQAGAVVVLVPEAGVPAPPWVPQPLGGRPLRLQQEAGRAAAWLLRLPSLRPLWLRLLWLLLAHQQAPAP